MGKSLGNAYMITDIEAKGYSPLDLRYFFFMAQYTSAQNFTWGALEQAKATRANLQKKIAKLVGGLVLNEASLVPTLAQLAEKFPQAEKLIDAIDEAMKDNLNTPKLLTIVNNALNSPTAEELEVLYRLEKRILKV
jgi:cysteinyl-tRNA synthetase